MNFLKVYNYKSVLITYLIVLLFGIIFHGAILEKLGVIVLAPPVALPLMIAMITGIFVGKFCQINLPPIPRTLKIIIKRILWVLFLNILAIIVTYLPIVVFNENLYFLSIVRNVLVASFFSTMFSIFNTLKNVYWLFPTCWILVTMLFGNVDVDQHPFYDFVLNSKYTHFEFILSVFLFMISTIFFGIKGSSMRIKYNI
jgi:hypothetical protein